MKSSSLKSRGGGVIYARGARDGLVTQSLLGLLLYRVISAGESLNGRQKQRWQSTCLDNL